MNEWDVKYLNWAKVLKWKSLAWKDFDHQHPFDFDLIDWLMKEKAHIHTLDCWLWAMMADDWLWWRLDAGDFSLANYNYLIDENKKKKKRWKALQSNGKWLYLIMRGDASKGAAAIVPHAKPCVCIPFNFCLSSQSWSLSRYLFDYY